MKTTATLHRWLKHGVLLGLLMAVLLVSQAAQAKQGEFALSLSAGTGYLVGHTTSSTASSSSISRRNPTLLDLDFQYEALSWLAPSLRTEITVEGGEALTLVPGIVFDSDGDVITGFGRIGVAIRIEPNYYGIDIGGGFIWHFLEHLGLVTEVNIETFFAGDGLGGGYMMPILVFVGLRGNV